MMGIKPACRTVEFVLKISLRGAIFCGKTISSLMHIENKMLPTERNVLVVYHLTAAFTCFWIL